MTINSNKRFSERLPKVYRCQDGSFVKESSDGNITLLIDSYGRPVFQASNAEIDHQAMFLAYKIKQDLLREHFEKQLRGHPRTYMRKDKSIVKEYPDGRIEILLDKDGKKVV